MLKGFVCSKKMIDSFIHWLNKVFFTFFFTIASSNVKANQNDEFDGYEDKTTTSFYLPFHRPKTHFHNSSNNSDDIDGKEVSTTSPTFADYLTETTDEWTPEESSVFFTKEKDEKMTTDYTEETTTGEIEEKPPGDSNNSNVGIIIGIVLGSLSLLLILAALSYCIYAKCYKSISVTHASQMRSDLISQA